ncbi:nucleoside hydrolase [Vibrio artabrorum]|uniref:nucleoside hydrolase n=1 Tax=Vibrio artabrorum TaxID=446374 RepID=UPI00354DED32
MKNILIDTDIGDDIDDVFALAYALKLMSENKCNLVGVTTVFKNTHLRAKIAAHFLNTAGYPDIPVYAGRKQPLVNSVDVNQVPNQYLDDMEQAVYENIDGKEMDAVDFIYQTLKNSVTKISLLSIGPLTNIAILIERHPDVVNLISEVYIMGGCFYNHMNEWNIECDPDAADVVFRSGLTLMCVGLDVTTKCKLTKEYTDSIDLDSNQNGLLVRMMSEWFQQLDRDGQTTPLLHDPLALHAMIFDDVKFQKEVVNVELNGKFTRGATYIEPYRLWGGTPPLSTRCHVAYDVDSHAFVDTFFSSVF